RLFGGRRGGLSLVALGLRFSVELAQGPAGDRPERGVLELRVPLEDGARLLGFDRAEREQRRRLPRSRERGHGEAPPEHSIADELHAAGEGRFEKRDEAEPLSLRIENSEEPAADESLDVLVSI